MAEIGPFLPLSLPGIVLDLGRGEPPRGAPAHRRGVSTAQLRGGPAPRAVAHVPTLRALGDAPIVRLAQARTTFDVDQLPQDVRERMRHLGLGIQRSGDRWELQSPDRHLAFNMSLTPDARVNARLLPGGNIQFDIRYGERVTNQVIVDFEARQVRSDFRAPDLHSVTSAPIGFTNSELGDIARRLEAGDPTARVYGMRIPVKGYQQTALRELFHGVDPTALRLMSYNVMRTGMPDGFAALTVGGNTFVRPGASQDFINNELSHQAWFRLADSAWDRGTAGRPFDSPSYNRFLNDVHQANWFTGRDFGVPIRNNTEANELVSDAASIGTRSEFFYHTLDLARTGNTLGAEYGASSALARNVLATIFERRGHPVGREQVDSLFARVQSGDQMASELNLTRDELAFVRGEYMRIGADLVRHYHSQLPAAVARALAPPAPLP